ncbi:MAG: agmatine deiminase family protein [Gammaproteobacteria bacterium]|nr:MAG: agmatine deiminase family protein [Gammaproteobacteria bacterium]
MTMTTSLPWPEWGRHSATIIYWPVRREIWPNGIETAEKAYLRVIHAIAEREPVILIVPETHAERIRRMVSRQVILVEKTLDDSWARDTAPIFATRDGHIVANCWKFNAWGEKFSPFAHDAEAATFVAHWLKTQTPDVIEIATFDWVLEGGAIHTNGAGVLLVTEECLLHPNRNGIVNKRDVEQRLEACYGAQRVLWLPLGLEGDVDTDGHIDNVACFLDEHTLLMQRPSRNDPDWPRFEKNLAAIKQWQAEGVKIDLALIDLPEPVFVQGIKVPRSYVNFAWANHAIVLPAFDCPQDDAAREFFRQAFPNRDVVSVPANDIVAGGGGIHCITMPIPHHETLTSALGGFI